jgi:hypothetical protein
MTPALRKMRAGMRVIEVEKTTGEMEAQTVKIVMGADKLMI